MPGRTRAHVAEPEDQPARQAGRTDYPVKCPACQADFELWLDWKIGPWQRAAMRRVVRRFEPRALVQVEAKPWSLVCLHLIEPRIPAVVVNAFEVVVRARPFAVRSAG